MKKICAWCNAYMGIVAESQPGVTHGICRPCFSMLEEKRLLKKKAQNRIYIKVKV